MSPENLLNIKKSEDRRKLEDHIRKAHQKSLDLAMEMVHKEFGDDLEAALADDSFVKKVQYKIKNNRGIYRKGYRQLEELEARENHQAMFAYAAELDLIAEHIPHKNRFLGYYPFSGTDFYWARIFKKVVFEDISFDCKEELPTTWWGVEDCSLERRDSIVRILTLLNIVTHSNLEFLSQDADICRDNNKFNNNKSTLLLKGGCDVLEYIDKRFKDKKLKYGSIIIADSMNVFEDIKDRFLRENYHKQFYLRGENFIAPYAMELKNAYIFIKK